MLGVLTYFTRRVFHFVKQWSFSWNRETFFYEYVYWFTVVKELRVKHGISDSRNAYTRIGIAVTGIPVSGFILENNLRAVY